jgi:hypothetical protein
MATARLLTRYPNGEPGAVYVCRPRRRWVRLALAAAGVALAVVAGGYVLDHLLLIGAF